MPRYARLAAVGRATESGVSRDRGGVSMTRVVLLALVIATAACVGHAAEVTIDHQRMCPVVDGEPFFAIGACGIPPEHMRECADAGFNLAIRWRPPPCPSFRQWIAEDPAAARAAMRKDLDAAAQAGLMVIEMPGTLYGWSELNYGLPDFPARFDHFIGNELGWIVDNVRDHPALLGYYGPDESDLRGTADDWRAQLRSYSETIRARDPRHLVFFLFSSNILPWPECYDIAGRDWYPYPGETRMVSVCRVARHDAAVAHSNDRPYWHMPMMEVSSGCRMRPISADEQTAQIYLALIGGADGIVWWVWPPRQVDNWNAVKRLATEMRALSPVLVEPPQQTTVRSEPPELSDIVQLRAIRHGSWTWLLAANACETPARITIRLPAQPRDAARVWFEDRQASLAGGALSDAIEGFGRHVYEIHAQWPEDAEIALQVELQPLAAGPPAIHEPDPLQPNLVWDPGFEGQMLWAFSPGRDQAGTVGARRDDQLRHGGLWSALIECAGGTTAPSWEGRWVRLKPDTRYSFSGWGRSEVAGPAQAEMRLRLDGSFPGSIRSRLSLAVRDHAPWRQGATAFSTGDESVSALPQCVLSHALWDSDLPIGGRAWFDDLALVEAPPEVRNLLVNGGFEGLEAARGWPRAWWCPYSLLIPGHIGGDGALWGTDATDAYEGSRSLRMTNPVKPENAWANAASADQTIMVLGGLAQGSDYVFSAAMKTDRPSAEVLVLAGDWRMAERVKVSDRWERYVIPVQAQRAVEEPFLKVNLLDEGALWLDAVQFETGTQATPYREWRD